MPMKAGDGKIRIRLSRTDARLTASRCRCDPDGRCMYLTITLRTELLTSDHPHRAPA